MELEQNPYCNCLYYSANAFSRKMTELADEAFAVTGLAPSYAFVVMTVNNSPGITLGEIASIMMLKASTITRLVEKLEAKNFLYKEPKGRSIMVFPTEKAMDRQASIEKAWQGLYKIYSKLIGEDKANQLASELFEAANSLE